jgi:hypothetical protein
MYCPKCSQQQISEEPRFCSRCGFQLDAVKTLLAEEQNALAGGSEPKRGLTPARKRDILFGATAMLAGSILIALLMVSTVAGTPLQAVIIPLLLLWAALVSALLLSGHVAGEVSRLFSKEDSASLPKAPSDFITQVGASARRQSLPPVQSIPVSGPGSWRAATEELAPPLSITEHTTNSLDQK